MARKKGIALRQQEQTSTKKQQQHLKQKLK